MTQPELTEILDSTGADLDRGVITLPQALEVMALIARILERAERKGKAA